MKKYISAFIALLVFYSGAQTYTIQWKTPTTLTTIGGGEIRTLDFENTSEVDPVRKIGYFVIKIEGEINSVDFTKVEYLPCSKDEEVLLEAKRFANKIEFETRTSIARTQVYSFINLVPIVKGANGKLYKIKKFNLSISQKQTSNTSQARKAAISKNSVFSTGDWYKISVNKTGVYKLDLNYIKSIGIPETVDPNSLQTFGFGGLLPERNADNADFYDIPEIPILFVGNQDNKFDASEYFLVYLEGPNPIVSRGDVDQKKNIYSDKTFFFITHSQKIGKRIATKATQLSYDLEYDYYDFIYRHEQDETNYIHSGRDWVGESLVTNPILNFDIAIPPLMPNTEVLVTGKIHGSNENATTCAISFNGEAFNYTLYNRDNGLDFNRILVRSFDFNQTLNSDDIAGNINLNIKYSKVTSVDKANLDYFQITGKAKLVFEENYLNFRNVDAVGNNYSKYSMSTTKIGAQIWDVTKTSNIQSLPVTKESQGISFIDSSNQYKEYVIVDPSSEFDAPVFIEKTENQNISGSDVPDLLIVAYPAFMDAAERLASFRRLHDGYNVLVVSVDKVYNEFSSGRQDISGIRNLAKCLYDRDPSKFKWLLLFGACSYDYKDRIANNTNFVPIYETINSSDLILSYQSDDYYGLLDSNEGNTLIGGMLDIGIGRHPVRNTEEANAVVDKLIHYSSSKLTFDKWRNNLSFVCDDGDGNLHMNSTEQLVNEVEKYNSAARINKLYLPLYPEVSTPIGQESPVLSQRLLDEINRGTFLLNYSGHGREIGWAGENIITIETIRNLKNIDKLFFLITATCEFGRYDDPNNFSSIEQAILNPNGAAIATIGATRPVFASSNLRVNTSMMRFLYERTDGKYNTIGDIMRKSKNDGASVIIDENVKNYGLLSDPSLTLDYPKYDIVIDSIVDEKNIERDTLKALSKATIKGSVMSGVSEQNNFNGTLTLTLYDKEIDKLSKYDPLSGDNAYDPSYIKTLIKVRESIIYQGNALVRDGKFSVSLIIPKDISYKIGTGLILTYAKNDSSDLDAAGGYENFYIGDSDDNVPQDQTPPVVNLFLNDTTFLSGGIVPQNSTFIANISDESGINLSRSSVGHEIVMTIDGDTKNSIILNDYYMAETNSFSKGKVVFPLGNLKEGQHSISLKVWDTFNNSTTESTLFVVLKDDIAIGVVDDIPNPYDDFSNFSFSHNRPGEDLYMQIQIADIQGNIVRELYSDIPAASTVVSGVDWKTKINQSQHNISSGLYVYIMLLKSKYDGSTTSKAEKLVFIK